MKFEFFDPEDEAGSGSPRRKRSARKGESSFTLDWVSALGWNDNPLALRGFPIAGMEEERQQINLFFIKSKKFGLIKGKEGLGKSTLLFWLKKELDGYKDLDAHLISGKHAESDEQLRIQLADAYRGMFGRDKPLSTHELIELIEKKCKKRYVLLIDDADELPDGSDDILKALLELDSSIVATVQDKLSPMPGKDELGLTLKKRSEEDYERILVSRIESVGGHGMRPFGEKQLKTMYKAASNTKEFLQMAAEVAINLALKRVTQQNDVSLDDVEEEEDDESPVKKKSGKKKKYDDLIESLTEGMD